MMTRKLPKKFWLVIPLVIILALGLTLWKFKAALKQELITTVFERITGGKVSVDNTNGNLSLQGAQGNYSFDQGKVPDNFPKSFPVYPGSKFTGSWSAKGDNSTGISVIWETEDSLINVKTYYLSEFPNQGWKITSSFDADNSATISFEKNGNSGFLGITRAESLTTISVTVGIK